MLGDEYQKEVHNAEIVIQPAAESIKKVLPELQNCDVRILLAHATVEESRVLAKEFPQFQIVVTSDGRDIPPQQPEKIPERKPAGRDGREGNVRDRGRDLRRPEATAALSAGGVYSRFPDRPR